MLGRSGLPAAASFSPDIHPLEPPALRHASLSIPQHLSRLSRF